MAKRPSSKTTKPDQTTAPDLLDAALALMAETGWRQLDLAELARRAGVTLAEAHAFAPDRGRLLRRMGKRSDEVMLSLPLADLDGLSVREKLFELIMRRLESMKGWKPALKAMAEARDPCLALAGACNVDRATRIMASVGGMGVTGLRALAARRVLGLVYGQVLRVWLRDESPDASATMAELDRRLTQAGKLASWLAPRMRKPRSAGAGQPPEEAPAPA